MTEPTAPPGSEPQQPTDNSRSEPNWQFYYDVNPHEPPPRFAPPPDSPSPPPPPAGDGRHPPSGYGPPPPAGDGYYFPPPPRWDFSTPDNRSSPPRRLNVSAALAAATMGAVAAGLLAIYVVAAPYITVHQMKVAAENRDGKALSKYIDFPSLRQSIKEQVRSQFAQDMASDPNLRNNPFAAAGAAMGSEVAEALVNTAVTPEGIAKLMAGQNLRAESINSSNNGRAPFSSRYQEGVSKGYKSFGTFTVTVKGDDGRYSEFIFHRRGFTGIDWKLTDILLP